MFAHLRQLARNEPKDNRLSLWKELQRFECSSAVSVVFQIVAVNIDFLEQLDGDTIISTLAKMHPVLRKVRPSVIYFSCLDTNLEVSSA